MSMGESHEHMTHEGVNGVNLCFSLGFSFRFRFGLLQVVHQFLCYDVLFLLQNLRRLSQIVVLSLQPPAGSYTPL
jgi:hypothetical protein